ncbi:hypothetical protein FPQ18DRAFT_308165 [Pyronema domesticum]|nr:hypothetical protein FPQ18DRAFT_308165 [Pyronema domesticum]
MDHALNPGGGPGQISPPPEVPGTPAKGPRFTLSGDGTGQETDNVMHFSGRPRRKRHRGDWGDLERSESGPVMWLVASQFGTVNAKQDTALQKVTSQQEEIAQLRQKLEEA